MVPRPDSATGASGGGRVGHAEQRDDHRGRFGDRRLWASEEQDGTLIVVSSHDKAEGDMVGWEVPEPSCTSDEQLRREREDKGGELVRPGLLRSERLRRAMLAVRREDFVPAAYRDHATLVGIVRRAWRDE